MNICDVFLQRWLWVASLDRLIAPSFGWAAACQRSYLLYMPSLEVLWWILEDSFISIALEPMLANMLRLDLLVMESVTCRHARERYY